VGADQSREKSVVLASIVYPTFSERDTTLKLGVAENERVGMGLSK
jgi:hypothetical protein